MIVVLGDFHARILTDPGLPRHVGRNIFQGEHPLGTCSEEVLDKSERFLDFLLQQDTSDSIFRFLSDLHVTL